MVEGAASTMQVQFLDMDSVGSVVVVEEAVAASMTVHERPTVQDIGIRWMVAAQTLRVVIQGETQWGDCQLQKGGVGCNHNSVVVEEEVAVESDVVQVLQHCVEIAVAGGNFVRDVDCLGFGCHCFPAVSFCGFPSFCSLLLALFHHHCNMLRLHP